MWSITELGDVINIQYSLFTLLAKITYSLLASFAWFGFCTATDRKRLNSFLRSA